MSQAPNLPSDEDLAERRFEIISYRAYRDLAVGDFYLAGYTGQPTCKRAPNPHRNHVAGLSTVAALTAEMILNQQVPVVRFLPE